MINKRLNPNEEKYLDWICKRVGGDSCERPYNTYNKIFKILYLIEFTSDIPSDNDRIQDGLNLRYMYLFETHDNYMVTIKRPKPCSVLEMMAYLAIRIEEQILSNPMYGDRTCQWFREMLWTLGIGGQTDEVFNEEYVVDRINRFINHEYEPSGMGGLFLVRHTDVDMRELDIWSQAMNHINEILY